MSLESSYAYIRRYSTQRQTMEEPKVEPDSMVHMVSRNGPLKGKKSNGKKNSFTCTHCGEKGHSEQSYYEIIGYPEWWDFTKKPRKKLSQATVVTSAQETPMAAHTSTTDSGMSHQNQKQINNWIIDTGATDDMVNDKNLLTTLHAPKQSIIQTASGELEKVTCEGVVQVSSSMNLDSVLVFPSLSSNLLSVSQITKALNCYVIFWPNDCDIETTLLCYYLEENTKSQDFHTRIKDANKSMAMLWHRRLGHLSFSYLKKLIPNLFLCFHERDFRCDVWGPAPISTPSGARYFVTFVDECTRMIWISLLKNKGDVSFPFKELYNLIKTEYRRDIQILQSDNEGEYINHAMMVFLPRKLYSTSNLMCPNPPVFCWLNVKIDKFLKSYVPPCSTWTYHEIYGVRQFDPRHIS
ncbi:LOW QUALITY PROTEIN: hypothetical protein OSB04_031132 [Centaurea solstitialis]|uniref:Integrase catalytic domain-containing protein n=1 Tax=Centaurea solstitialis TaxID=347529 RepID=A0AA38W5P2_9ASTR|nr:LOW QUALITY PROTEIN: hypothetical protein OSB04_031132 [Centaurea solstitialis]